MNEPATPESRSARTLAELRKEAAFAAARVRDGLGSAQVDATSTLTWSQYAESMQRAVVELEIDMRKPFARIVIRSDPDDGEFYEVSRGDDVVFLSDQGEGSITIADNKLDAVMDALRKARDYGRGM
jgi:hypothetical protein